MKMTLTYKEHLKSPASFIDDSVYELLVSLGCNPDHTISESLPWFMDLQKGDRTKILNSYAAAIQRAQRRRWKDPHRVDKQPGAKGRVLAEKGGHA